MTEPQLGGLVCANHPDRETYLRCNRCNKPICIECAVLTPTGYRCKECVRGQQRVFETARTIDYVFAGGIALALSFLGSYIVPVMQFFTIFVAPIVGMIAAEIIRRAVNRRRSRLLYQLAAVGAVVGGLPLLVSGLLSLVGMVALRGAVGLTFFLPLIWQGVYIFLLTSTLYYRLSGIRM
jgi:hypothetical protein